MIVICNADHKEYTVLDGADFYYGDKSTSTYSAPAIDNDGNKYICCWTFYNDDIKDVDLEDLEWDYCDKVIPLD